jgi:hypothetical protein
MSQLPPPLRRRQRLFLLLGLLFPLLGLASMTVQVLQWNRAAPVAGALQAVSMIALGMFVFVVLPMLVKFWLSRRHYLQLLRAEPMPDEEFVKGCSNLVDTSLTPELAVDIRDTLEEKLMLPRGVLRPDTNLMRLGMWAYFLYAPAVMQKYHVDTGELKATGLDLRRVGNVVAAVERVMGTREYLREEPVQLAHAAHEVVTASAEVGEPLVLRETGRLFRRWFLANLIFVPVAIFLGALFSLGGLAGTVIAVLFFGFLLFLTVVVAAFFHAAVIDPQSRRVTLTRELFGQWCTYKREKRFEEFSVVRVYQHRDAESKKLQEDVHLIPAGEGDGWMLGDSGRISFCPHADVETARRVSALMHLPLEIVQHRTPLPRWLRRFFGGEQPSSAG